MKKVKEYGGRFLKQNDTDGLWYEISDKDARRKASQGKYKSCQNYFLVDLLDLTHTTNNL